MVPQKIYGLIGHPVKHSLSPAMHNAAFKARGINAEYRLFEILPEELEEFLLNPDKIVKDTKGNSLRSGDILGFNITIPYKVRAKEILEKSFSVSEDIQKHAGQIAAQMIGAVNTVSRQPQFGFYNTDSLGFYVSLKHDLGFDAEHKTVLVLGCGGAGRAIVSSLITAEESAKKVYIYEVNSDIVSSVSRDFSQWKYLDGKWEFITVEQLPEIIKKCELLVNATPLGMKRGDKPAIDKKLLFDGLSVYDAVYNRETELVKNAKSQGLAASGGLGMLLYQGVTAWEIWTNRQAPVEIMKKALESAIRR